MKKSELKDNAKASKDNGRTKTKLATPKPKNIHEGHRQRLRESVEKNKEMDALSDIEVLEYLLSFLIPRKDTNPISHELLETFGSLFGVLSASSDELFKIKNMTAGAASLLPNLTAIIRKAGISRTKRLATIAKTCDAVEVLKPYFINRNTERLYMMSIDVQEHLMQIDLISDGTASFTMIEFAKILAIVMRVRPSNVILAHNHPSGCLTPSNNDIYLTESLTSILKTVGVKLLDHIVFCEDEHLSFFHSDIISFKSEDYDGDDSEDSSEMRDRKELGRYCYEKNKSETISPKIANKDTYATPTKEEIESLMSKYISIKDDKSGHSD